MTLNLLFFNVTIKTNKMTREEAINEAIHRKYKEENVTKMLSYQKMF